MTTVTSDRHAIASDAPSLVTLPGAGPGSWAAFATLAGRRLALSARTPRELLVPLMTPVLFALVIAPALRDSGSAVPGLDYLSFAALGTVGLLVPLNAMFAGIGVLADRESGARRDLLAAPIARPLLVAGNLAVTLLTSGLQVAVLLVAAVLRGADFASGASSVAWFTAAALVLNVGMYGVAEAMANRIPKVEEYVGAVPAIAIVPWFFAGSLFPIHSLPVALAAFAKVLPLTHALAVIRYGLVDPSGRGLHDIWGMSNTAAMAALSLAVVVGFAALMMIVAVRVFTRSAVQ